MYRLLSNIIFYVISLAPLSSVYRKKWYFRQVLSGHGFWHVACPWRTVTEKANHWWGISSYQRAGGTSRRVGGEIPQHLVWNALLLYGLYGPPLVLSSDQLTYRLIKLSTFHYCRCFRRADRKAGIVSSLLFQVISNSLRGEVAERHCGSALAHCVARPTVGPAHHSIRSIQYRLQSVARGKPASRKGEKSPHCWSFFARKQHYCTKNSA